MNDLERLLAALRAAHAAGNTADAQRIAALIVRVRAAEAAAVPSATEGAAPLVADGPAPYVPQPVAYDAEGRRIEFDLQGNPVGVSPVAQESDEPAGLVMPLEGQPGQGTAFGDQEFVQLRAPYDPNQAAEDNAPVGPIGFARAKLERGEPLTEEEARVLGFSSAQEAAAAVPASEGPGEVRRDAIDGMRMMAHGLTWGLSPILAGAGAAVVPGGRGYAEARDASRENIDRIRADDPAGALAAEFAGGLASGGFVRSGLARALGAASPRAARAASSVFSLQSGQTAKNLGRLAATGAAAGGTAAVGEGDAVLPAMGVGAVAGPVGAGVVRGVTKVGRMGTQNAAYAHLARLWNESAESIAQRAEEFQRLRGRAPRLIELAPRETGEEVGELARSWAGRTAAPVLRRTREEMTDALQRELPEALQDGRALTSATAQRALLPGAADIPLTGPRFSASAAAAAAEETRDVATRRALDPAVSGERTTVPDVLGERDVEMNQFMAQYGDHQIPVTPDMLDIIQDPDVMGAITDAGVRRGLQRRLRAFEPGGPDPDFDEAMRQHEMAQSLGWTSEAPVRMGNAMEGETPFLRLRDWDTIRRYLTAKVQVKGGNPLYRNYRDRVRNHAVEAFDEYGDALDRFGEQSDIAKGVRLGSRALRQDTENFVANIRTAGGGTRGTATRPDARANQQQGAAMGARQALANVFSGTPEKASRFLAQLSRNPGMRASLRAVLSPEEVTQLEGLSTRYGQQLDFSQGAKAGARVVRRGDAESLAAALQQRGLGAEGASRSVRAELAAALEGTEDQQRKMMERLAGDPAYRARVGSLLTADEARALERIGARYGRRLEVAEGVELGRGAFTRDSEDFVTAVREAHRTPTTSAGVRAGTRTDVVERASEGPEGALRTAIKLSDDDAVIQRIGAALGLDEATRMRAVGGSVKRGVQNIVNATPTLNAAQQRSQEAGRMMQQSIGAIVVALGRSSGAMRANVFNHIVQRLRVRPGVAKKLAEIITDPDPERQAEAIEIMRRMGKSREEILRIYQRAAAASGLVAGERVQ